VTVSKAMILKKLDKADKANFEAELLNDKVKTFMMEEVRTRNPSLNLSNLKLDHGVEILMGSRSFRCNENIQTWLQTLGYPSIKSLASKPINHHHHHHHHFETQDLIPNP
jgi:hypothetical protein